MRAEENTKAERRIRKCRAGGESLNRLAREGPQRLFKLLLIFTLCCGQGMLTDVKPAEASNTVVQGLAILCSCHSQRTMSPGPLSFTQPPASQGKLTWLSLDEASGCVRGWITRGCLLQSIVCSLVTHRDLGRERRSYMTIWE
jgi:hypothetical protein